MSAQWTTVCNLDELTPGLGVCALVDDVQVALFYIDGKVYALDNHDPFSHANVISRGITGDLQGKVVVASPVYKQHFELATGQCLEDEEVCLNTYPVELADNNVRVSVSMVSVKAA